MEVAEEFEGDIEVVENEADGDGPLPPHRKRHQRHLLACVGCRKIKTRCLGNEDQVSACQRCQRLKLECVYARKRRRKLTAEPANAPLQPPTYTYRTPNPIRPGPTPGGAGGAGAAATPLVDPSPGAAASSLPFLLDMGSVGSGTSGVTSPLPITGTRVDIREYLDPPLSRDGLEESASTRRAEGVAGEDPITVQLVTLHEAETLVALYMQHLHPLIATLDPKLHTLAYLRTSPLLLSGLLTVSSKYFQQRSYPALLEHARNAINCAVGEGRCDVGLIQALILMVTWKDPHDGSSWVKLGIAIRLGYQLGMHVQRRTLLPRDTLEARQVVDIERTWYTLSSFDRLYSDVYSLPPTIRLEEIPDATEWAKETAYLGCGDFRHACSFSSASTYRMWVQYRRNLRSMSRDLAWVILNDLYGQIEAHMKRWFPRDPAFGKISPFEQTYLKWFDLNHLTKIKYHMIDNCPTSESEANVLDWLLLADEFTKQTEALGRLGTLRFLQDTSATHISSFGIMVYNLFSRLPTSQKRLAIEHVRRLSNCSEEANAGDGDTVMGLVGRFMRRLKLVLENCERENARAIAAAADPTPSANGSASAPAVPYPAAYRVQAPRAGALPAVPSTLPMLPNIPPVPVSTTAAHVSYPDPIGAQLDLDDFFRTLLQTGTGVGADEAAASVHGWWFDPNVVLN